MQNRVLVSTCFPSCLSFNSTNIYQAQPCRGPGLGVAEDGGVGQRVSCPLAVSSSVWLTRVQTSGRP